MAEILSMLVALACVGLMMTTLKSSYQKEADSFGALHIPTELGALYIVVPCLLLAVVRAVDVCLCSTIVLFARVTFVIRMRYFGVAGFCLGRRYHMATTYMALFLDTDTPFVPRMTNASPTPTKLALLASCAGVPPGPEQGLPVRHGVDVLHVPREPGHRTPAVHVPKASQGYRRGPGESMCIAHRIC